MCFTSFWTCSLFNAYTYSHTTLSKVFTLNNNTQLNWASSLWKVSSKVKYSLVPYVFVLCSWSYRNYQFNQVYRFIENSCLTSVWYTLFACQQREQFLISLVCAQTGRQSVIIMCLRKWKVHRCLHHQRLTAGGCKGCTDPRYTRGGSGDLPLVIQNIGDCEQKKKIYL